MEIFGWIQQQHDSIIFKLILAGTLSLVIGLERELKKKPVGLKTSLVIAIFSCLLTYISIESAYDAKHSNEINITMDPLRLAAQIVTGIGFLGAGVILRRGNDSITGLTTAAMIWGAGAIGIAVGAEYYFEATAGVFIMLFGIEVIPPFLMKFGPKRLRMRELSLTIVVNSSEAIGSTIKHFTTPNFHIENVRIMDSTSTHEIGKKILVFRMSYLKTQTIHQFYDEIHSLPEVHRIELDLL